MSSYFPNLFSDCLVLCIDEPDLTKTQLNNIDNRVFILFDPDSDKFMICGKRQDLKVENPTRILPPYKPYTFFCWSDRDTFTFIKSILDRRSNGSVIPTIGLTLYNFKDLPEYTENITYNRLVELSRIENEMFGIDLGHVNDLPQYIRMLRKVRNM